MDIFSIIGHIVIYGVAALVIFGISLCIVRFMAGSSELENSNMLLRRDIESLKKELTELKSSDKVQL